MIKIKNVKVATLLEDKEKLIEQGRGISYNIEKVEKKITKLEEKEKEITSKIEPKELIEQGNAINQQIDNLTKDLQSIADKIYEAKYSAIPKEMRLEHQGLIKLKGDFEIDRNKVALKVQKIKDRVIPLIRKECVSQLGEFEDIETAVLKNGVVTVKTFNHLEDWKKAFTSKKK